MDELEESYERYKAQKNNEERDMNVNLLRTIAHLETITDRCKQLEAGNQVLQDRVKEAEAFEKELTSKLTLVSARLETTTDRCTKLEAGNQILQDRLEEAEASERESTSKLTIVSAQLETTTDRCAKLEAGNQVFKDRMKEADEFARKSTTKSKLVAGQHHNITCRCAKLQTELDVLGTRLAEVDSELKVERQPSDSELNKKIDGLRRELEESTAQKERTIEKLGLANNAVFRLQEELKTTQKAVDVSQSSLLRAKSMVRDMNGRVRTLQCYVTDTQTKRRRAEEDLADERDAKRRLIEERDSIETRWCAKVDEAAQCQAERQQLKAGLQMERKQRKRAEESVAEANAKLDQVVITDSLTAVFVKFDQILLQVVKEASSAEDSSTSR